jgi:hypothetical protein
MGVKPGGDRKRRDEDAAVATAAASRGHLSTIARGEDVADRRDRGDGRGIVTGRGRGTCGEGEGCCGARCGRGDDSVRRQ